MIALRAEEPFGVYVHWPFCLAKCPYCDFNSHVRHGGVAQRDFVAAYRAELRHFAALAPSKIVTSIFFGGGTPSLMEPETVAPILDEIAALWSIAPDAEITLEANPTSVEASRFAGYRASGVNRVSLGIQALDDQSLKALGRMHDVEEALAALAIAKRNFPRVSFDLIYARQGQELAAWREELARALALVQDHLSLYQLTIEDGTPFASLHRAGRLTIPEPARGEAFYQVTQELCDAAGLPAYEVSNHARQGAESRHNLLYWRGHDYAGVGAGAHSRIATLDGKRAYSTFRAPEAWLEAVMRDGHGIETEERLSGAEAGDEYLLMGLRLAEGIDLGKLEAIGGKRPRRTQVQSLAEAGLLSVEGDHIAATPSGRVVLDRLILELAA